MYPCKNSTKVSFIVVKFGFNKQNYTYWAFRKILQNSKGHKYIVQTCNRNCIFSVVVKLLIISNFHLLKYQNSEIGWFSTTLIV